MGKSFASLKRQVNETRKRSKKRGGGEVGRTKRETLYAHQRKRQTSESEITDLQQPKRVKTNWTVTDVTEPTSDDKSQVDESDDSSIYHANVEPKATITTATTRNDASSLSHTYIIGDEVVHEIRDVRPDDKQKEFLTFMQEYRDNEINARQKRKVVVFVQEAKTAKALCTSLGQHRRMYKAMKKGFVKKKYSDTKGVAVLLKYLKDEEQEQVVNFFRSGRITTVIVTDDCSSDLWGQKSTISLVINYDMPPHADLYDNRSGLAGHAEARVISFLTPTRANREMAPGLVDYLQRLGHPISSGLASLKAIQEQKGAKRKNYIS